MPITMLILIAILGLCLGSFIHVVISRFTPKQNGWDYLYCISVKHSTCPNCCRRLGMVSLIPLLSWVLQRGRCRSCNHSIPIHYPLLELVTAIYCVIMIAIYGLSIWSMTLIAIGLYFFVIAIIDYRYFIIPNYFCYFLLLSGLLEAYFTLGLVSLSAALIGIIFGYALLWLPATGYYLIKKNHGLGGGDIKLLAALGTWVDYRQLPMLLVGASLIGMSYFIAYCYIKKPESKIVIIPFGPCLLLSAYGILLSSSIN